MKIKRRKDCEREYQRYTAPWRTIWQFGDKLYFVNFILHPDFLFHQLHMFRGHRLIMLWWYIKHPVEYWSEAISPEEFAKRSAETELQMQDVRKMFFETIVKSQG